MLLIGGQDHVMSSHSKSWVPGKVRSHYTLLSGQPRLTRCIFIFQNWHLLLKTTSPISAPKRYFFHLSNVCISKKMLIFQCPNSQLKKVQMLATKMNFKARYIWGGKTAGKDQKWNFKVVICQGFLKITKDLYEKKKKKTKQNLTLDLHWILTVLSFRKYGARKMLALVEDQSLSRALWGHLLTPVPGDLMPSSGLHVHSDINTHTHTIKNNNSKCWCSLLSFFLSIPLLSHSNMYGVLFTISNPFVPLSFLLQWKRNSMGHILFPRPP